MDISKIVAVVAQVLQDDDTLNDMVNGQIISGFRRALADDYLEESNHACIGVRNLSKNSQGLPGCASHGASTQEMLIEVRIITLLSKTRQDDSYAAAIASEIEDLLKPGITKTMNGVFYQLIVGAINFTPLNDDQFNDRIEMQATVKLKFYG